MEALTLVRRYAEALFLAAQEHRATARVAQDLRHLEHHFKALPEMRSLLCDPDLPVETRRAYLYRFFPRRATRLVRNFFNLLLDQDRCGLIEHISAEFRNLWREAEGRLRVEVESRFSLSDRSRRRLTRALERFTGARVELRERVARHMIGGVRIRIGDALIDYSIAGELDRLKRHLAG